MGGERPDRAGQGALRGTDRQRLAAACAVALVAALAGVWFSTTLRGRDATLAAHPQAAGAVALAGVERPVRIDRDRRGVPHVDAASEADAYFALGFCQAQDRLAQLVALRRHAHGTAAEHVGERALDADRMARLLDFRGIAERQWSGLPRATRRALEAYAAGVSARIARIRAGDAAPPRALDGQAIEPWRPQDSLALFKLFAWSLSASVDASLVLNELVATLGPIEAGRFFPERGVGDMPRSRTTAQAAPWVGRGEAALRGAYGLGGFGVGSSAFVVGGAHTDSGRPVLVADSHFEPTAPAALYLAHLRAPGLDVAGATLAGVPVFWWGRNPHLAWASVNAGAVVTDLYTETLRRDGSEYHDGRRWRKVEQREEVLRVRRRADARLAVRSTSRGPLLPEDDDAGRPRAAISVAWTGARDAGRSGIGSLLALARAEDPVDLRAALARHHEPPIAVVWAAGTGEAGRRLAGWIPQRSLAAQMLPLPGRAPWYAWDEPIAFDALPSRMLEDGRGTLVAADQAYRAAEAETPIDAVWRSGARARRLETLLAQAVRDGSDLRRLASLLGDDRLARSRRLIEVALARLGDAPRGEEAGELERWLREWDGQASADSVGAAVYHVYLGVLADALFAPHVGAELFARVLAVRDLDLEGLVLGVLRDAAEGGGPDRWAQPEAVREAVAASLREAWLALSFRLGPDPRQWRWGGIHRLRFRDLASGDTAFGPFDYAGAPHAVLAADYSPADPFDVRTAATARFAIDAGSLDVALTALAPGQSEHAGHANASDGLAGWLEGRWTLVATRRIDVEDRSVARLVLEPLP